MARDPISAATTSLLLPGLEAEGFKRFTNRIIARIVDDTFQFVSVHLSRRGTRWFKLHYASICLFRPRDGLPLQPGDTIFRTVESSSALRRLFRIKERRFAFDGTGPESANASMSEAAPLVAAQAIPFFERTRTTLLLYEILRKERWGAEHHLQFQMGCCLARLQRLSEAEKALRRAVRLYEKDGYDWCRDEIKRVNSLLTAIKEGRSDEQLNAWTRTSISNLELGAFAAKNFAQQTLVADRR
jgi:hypothetical protein